MKQIYNFEAKNPPVLSERILAEEIEKRNEKRQTTMLFVSGIVIQFVILLFGFMAFDFYPIVTMGCVLYALLSVAASGIMAGIYVKREERVIYGNR